jgi:CBS domain-containing protein
MGQTKAIIDVMDPGALLVLPPETTVRTAAWTMLVRGLGTVVVGTEDQVLGLVTERDLSLKVVSCGLNPDRVTLKEIMTAVPQTVPPETTVDQALTVMQQNDAGYLAIKGDGKALGVVSLSDLKRHGPVDGLADTGAMAEPAFRHRISVIYLTSGVAA